MVNIYSGWPIFFKFGEVFRLAPRFALTNLARPLVLAVRDVPDRSPFSTAASKPASGSALKNTGVNRGASGIDGIIASASGFADATALPRGCAHPDDR